MIKYQGKCKVCQAIKKNPKLGERIYRSTAFNPTGEESMYFIASQHDFSYDSMKNHCKKHQFISESAADQKMIEKMNKNTEIEIANKIANHVDVRDIVMQKGYEGVVSGQTKVTASNMITAARDQMNYESKQADRNLAMAEMIFHYASGSDVESKYNERKLRGQSRTSEEVIEGETVADDNPAVSPAGDYPTGPLRPSSVYDGATGDVPAPRPSTLPPQRQQEDKHTSSVE